MKLIKGTTSALLTLLMLALNACGGAGGGADVVAGLSSIAGGVGTGGTGIVFGPVTGFGSVVVDGTAYSSATPQYFSVDDRGDEVRTTSASLALGNQVQLRLDAQGNPSSIIIEPALIGTVERIGAGEFVVNGMPVRANADAAAGPATYYAGLDGFASLAPGMRVAVHGAYGVEAGGQQAYYRASLIEQLPGSSTGYRLSGQLSNWNAVAGTFQIGATTMQTSASTRIVPAGTALSNGLWVDVWSNTALGAGGRLNAGMIRARTLAGTTGQVQISGVVSMLSATQFQVSGTQVDAASSALASVVRNLASGAYVVVQGRLDPRGALIASSVRTYAAQSVQVKLSGTITGYVNQGNFLVRGVPVDGTQASLLGAASGANLRNGMFVDVVGSISKANGNIITATSVYAASKPPTGGTVNYQGTVSQFDAASGSFILTGSLDEEGASAKVRLAPNAAYANGTGAQLVDGARVEIEATSTDGGIVAYGLSFSKTGASASSPTSGKLETKGLAYGVTSDAFMVNGLRIQINGVSPKGGSLVNGTKVEVEFMQAGMQNLAREIAIDD